MNCGQLAQVRNRRIGFISRTSTCWPGPRPLENVEVPLLYNTADAARTSAKKLCDAKCSIRVGLGQSARSRPEPAFRRSAAACRHRPGAHQQARDPVVR